VSVADSAITGMTTQTLTAVRDHLAALLDVAGPREAPALARELRAVMAEIAANSSPGEANPIDDLAARRTARRSASGAAGS
jgi:hypothetical protein